MCAVWTNGDRSHPDVTMSGGTDDWMACPGCDTLIYGRRYLRAHRVCYDCGDHGHLTARERIAQLLDAGAEDLPDPHGVAVDPLGFADTVPYPARVARARARTGLDEAVICVRGAITGVPVIAAVMDFRFLGGSLGCEVGERITLAAEAALRDAVPLIMVTASGGARMQEGTYALFQMAKTSQALVELDAAGVLTVSVVTDPTYGGVAASFATLADVILIEPGARMGFAGPRVIEQTIRQTLPPGFQRAETLLGHGLVDAVVDRDQLRSVLGRLLSAVTAAGRPPPTAGVDDPRIARPGLQPEREPWEAVQRSRDTGRPTTLDYLHRIADGFEELHGDRAGEDCPAVVGGIGRLGGMPIMAIGHQKGHTTRELIARNFGMPTPAGYRKAARLLRLADKLALPVVTMIDTPGAYPGIAAENAGQANAISANLALLSRLRVPVISVITGEGGSGGALALAVADRVLMLANATLSVISPEGCAAILWRHASFAPTAAAALRLDARQLLAAGLVDGVIPEPEHGAQQDPAATAAALAAALTATLAELRARSPDERLRERRARWRASGAVTGRQEVARR